MIFSNKLLLLQPFRAPALVQTGKSYWTLLGSWDLQCQSLLKGCKRNHKKLLWMKTFSQGLYGCLERMLISGALVGGTLASRAHYHHLRQQRFLEHEALLHPVIQGSRLAVTDPPDNMGWQDYVGGIYRPGQEVIS